MKPEHAESAEAIVIALANKTQMVAAGTTFFGWLLSSEGAVFTGLLLGVAGLAVQFLFHRRRDQREERELSMREREHDARMKRLAEQDTET